MHIFEYNKEALQELFTGKPKFRLDQFINGVYRNLEVDFDKISTLPKKIKEELKQVIQTNLPEITTKQTSTDGTTKYLLNLGDGSNIEMVLIPHKEKNTLCVSSQVGCSRGCTFCATAKLGLKRNLECNEIISQIFIAMKELGESKLTNIVFMGMGEPLDNFDNLVKAVKILQELFLFSPRKITVSTSGVIPKIDMLAQAALKVKLAVSLNSAIQEKRESLMPISKQYPLDELKNSLLSFKKKNPFRITFEYIMIKNFNMSDEDVIKLKRFLGDISCKLNLIKWNPVKGLPYESPNEKEIKSFHNKLMSMDSAVTYRKSRGEDIDAACGQLAGKQS